MPGEPVGLVAPSPQAAPAPPAATDPSIGGSSAAPAVPSADPGATIGIAGLVLSFVLAPVGLIVSIVAIVRSRRSGRRNGFAIAGVAVATTLLAGFALLAALIVPPIVDAVQTCADLGPGVHQVGNARYTCTPTSSHVFYSFG